jgi:cellulose synthase/poly-beta-1,6-N-acetylglucosamine synthase-like glycosyltransferase
MDISVVIPVLNEEEALPAFYRALAEALDRLPQSAEIIFADDGSTDGSADRLDAIVETDPRVRRLAQDAEGQPKEAGVSKLARAKGAPDRRGAALLLPVAGNGRKKREIATAEPVAAPAPRGQERAS